MARLARVVLPGVVHHITQRGVRSMDIFYHDKDRKEYLFLLNKQAQRVGLKSVSHCLMTNHIHLLVIPSKEESLRLGIGEAHLCIQGILILGKVLEVIYFRNDSSHQ